MSCLFMSLPTLKHGREETEIMSKTNDTSDLDHRELTETELDGVTGGLVVISIIQPLIDLLLPAVNREEKRS